MKTKTITLYEYSELSSEAKEKALNKWRETNDDPMMQSHMINLLKEDLDARGIKYNEDSIDVRYSLSHCQGDGFMFEGILTDDRGRTITIKHGGGHYYHEYSKVIDYPEASEKKYANFDTLYVNICKKMEREGYDHIEYTNSEESFIGECEANEWTFREDGTLED